jgi:putative SOS response-associated peptidase YedK
LPTSPPSAPPFASFRTAFRRRRCLVPADGYYEWQAREGRKQPYYIHMTDEQPFCFAGLWETWQPPEAEAVHSCTIITTAANPLSAEVHHRMPVILPQADYAAWLDPTNREPAALLPLLLPYPPEAMSLRVDEARCITPLGDS